MEMLLTVSMPISWFWYFTTILQDVTIEGNLVQYAQISLHRFLQLHVTQQLPQNPSLILKVMKHL